MGFRQVRGQPRNSVAGSSRRGLQRDSKSWPPQERVPRQVALRGSYPSAATEEYCHMQMYASSVSSVANVSVRFSISLSLSPSLSLSLSLSRSPSLSLSLPLSISLSLYPLSLSTLSPLSASLCSMMLALSFSLSLSLSLCPSLCPVLSSRLRGPPSRGRPAGEAR